MTVTIRPAAAHDQPRWRSLMGGYMRFYQREPDDAVLAHTWSRILDKDAPVHAFVAERQGEGEAIPRVVGIGNYVLHENTSTLTPVCYLQDLFVDAEARGEGIGRAMLDWLIARMKAERWPRLYWNTREDNLRARALYDSYTPHSGFIRYVLDGPAG